MKALYRILSLLKQKKNSTLSSPFIHIFYMFCFAFSRNAHTTTVHYKLKKKINQKQQQQKKNPQTNKPTKTKIKPPKSYNRDYMSFIFKFL